jgi:VanZ family protein
MSKTFRIVLRWWPAGAVMLVIFLFSAQPATDLPDFSWADTLVKKGGHMLGYAMLAMSYWRAFEFRDRRRWLAWALTLLYALTDEFHQSFVSGRNASLWDVWVFDNLGALCALWFLRLYKTQRSDIHRPIVENMNVKHG